MYAERIREYNSITLWDRYGCQHVTKNKAYSQRTYMSNLTQLVTSLSG